LRAADLGDRWHDHACQQAAADDVVLGGVSDVDALQRHLGAAAAEPAELGTAWMLAAKLRRAMVNPEREPLGGLVEADETIIPFRTKNDPVVVPAGRSGVGKMLVAGAVEIDGGKPRRARLKVIEGVGKQELQAFVLGTVAPQTQLVTDAWPSYHNLPGVRHDAITLGPMAAHIALPWIHRLFSNLKRWGLGVYHGLRKTNLQHYRNPGRRPFWPTALEEVLRTRIFCGKAALKLEQRLRKPSLRSRHNTHPCSSDTDEPAYP
jgi:hypothetical protein